MITNKEFNNDMNDSFRFDYLKRVGFLIRHGALPNGLALSRAVSALYVRSTIPVK